MQLKQYDISTASLNVKQNQKLYAETLDGIKNSEGEILEVILALHSLKESTIFWHEKLKKRLIKSGLNFVPGFPCLFTNSSLILLFFTSMISLCYITSQMIIHIKV